MATRLLLAACFALLPAAASADAPNPSFYLVNRSRQQINQVYVSPVSAAGWGRDQLGDDTLEPGANFAVRLHADGTCVFDLRIVYEDGRSEERRGVNTCGMDSVTFNDSGVAPSSTSPAPQTTSNPSFRAVNNSRRAIDELYVRRTGTPNWGEDRLGDDTIGAGETKVVHLPPGQCLWDVRVIFEGGRALEKRRLNLCEITDLPVP